MYLVQSSASFTVNSSTFVWVNLPLQDVGDSDFTGLSELKCGKTRAYNTLTLDLTQGCRIHVVGGVNSVCLLALFTITSRHVWN